MLQYSPDKLQWLLLTASGPVALLLLLVGLGLLLWMAQRALVAKKAAKLYAIGVPGLALILGSFLLSSLPSTTPLADGVARELSDTASFEDVKLLHLETVSDSPFSDGSVSFIGTATDVDGDPRQFRYTQYADFGVYDLVGFDKPAVNLKDESFKSTESGIEIYKGTEDIGEIAPSSEPTAPESSAPEAPATETPEN